MIDNDKHTGLLSTEMNYDRKKFYGTGPPEWYYINRVCYENFVT